MGSGGQNSPTIEQSLTEEADLCLAEMSFEGSGWKLQPTKEIASRCITNNNRHQSRSPNRDSKSVYKKHLSVADELSGFFDNDATPMDWGIDPSELGTETLCEGAEALEDVDLTGFGIHEDSKAAGSAGNNIILDRYKPKKPSRLAFEVQESDQEDDASDPVPRHEPTFEDQNPDSQSSDAESDSGKEDIEEINPRRSRLDAWLEEDHPGMTELLPWEGSLKELDSEKSEHRIALAVIAEDDEERDSSVTEVQRSSHETSRSTKVASNHVSSQSKSASDQDWSACVDSDEDVDLQSLISLIRVREPRYIADEKSLPHLPQSPLSVKASGLKVKELGGVIESSILKVNAIRSNRKDKHASSKIRDIQHLVEKVLMNEICGERRSLSDTLDGSAWRT